MHSSSKCTSAWRRLPTNGWRRSPPNPSKRCAITCATAAVGWCAWATAPRRAALEFSPPWNPLWPYTVELFAEDDLDRTMADAGIAPRLSDVRAAWSARIDAILAEATLQRPIDRPHSWHGKRGQHSEHLGYLLAEMQYLQRAYPGARW